jgi:alpha-ribazole phosphatase
MKLWLVRHARPLVEAGVCYGATDMAADEQATLASAQALARVLPQGLRVISSPLQRCEQLALSLCGLRPDLMLTRDARLAEMDFGCWEGQRWSDIPKAELDAWTADFFTLRFGGRESVQAFMQRVAAALADTTPLAQELVWITHAGVIRAVSLQAQGIASIDRADQWPQAAPAWGEWSEAQFE